MRSVKHFLRKVAVSINNSELENQGDCFAEHERTFLASNESKSEWVKVAAGVGAGAGATGGACAFRVLFERHESYLGVCLSTASSSPGTGKLSVVAKQQVWEAYRASGGNVTLHPQPCPEDTDTAVPPVTSNKKSKREKGAKEEISFFGRSRGCWQEEVTLIDLPKLRPLDAACSSISS